MNSMTNLKSLAKKIFYGAGFLIFNNAGISIHHRKFQWYLKHENKNRLNIYHQMFDENTLEKKPFYNIGSGSFFHPFWTNIDYISDWYKVTQKNIVHYDLMSLKPLPIEENSAKIIYTSHTIEHVKDEAVQNLFNESFRALEKGGICRITTGPDAETDYRALRQKDEDWFYWDLHQDKKGSFTKPLKESGIGERWLNHVATPLSILSPTPSKVKYEEEEIQNIIQEKSFEDALNFFTEQCTFNSDYPGDHISWWSHDKIYSYLKKAGFKTIYRSGYRQSASPLLRQSELFDSTHPQISIYVEAIKD